MCVGLLLTLSRVDSLSEVGSIVLCFAMAWATEHLLSTVGWWRIEMLGFRIRDDALKGSRRDFVMGLSAFACFGLMAQAGSALSTSFYV